MAVAALSAAALSLCATRGTTPPERTPEYLALLGQKEAVDSELAAIDARLKKAAADALAAAAREKALAGKLSAESSKRGGMEGKLNEALAKITALEKAVAEERERADTIKLDQPGGSHRLESVKDGEVVRFSGRIATLRVGSLGGGAVLDTSRLDAREIYIERGIKGKSKAVLKAAATVSVNGIAEGSAVEIDAPAGRVFINAITGDSRLKARTKELFLVGQVHGTKTEVDATLTAGGSLRFTYLHSGGKLTWRKEKPDDPEPSLSPGRVESGATFEKVK